MGDFAIDQDVAQSGSFSSSAVSHAGTANRLNEDGFVNRPDLGLWAVADGAGGHESGEVASAEVVASLQGIEPGLSAAEMLVEVRARLEQTHAGLHEAASQRGADVLMATTVVVLLVRDDHFACLWAGDSRAYLLRGHELTRITRDHSLVQALVESGTITENEAIGHPHANIITRAVGADSEALELEKRTGPLMAGDRLLLCTDGLCKTLPDDKLRDLLLAEGHAGAEPLVAAALEARVSDNVTAITIDIGPAARDAAAGTDGDSDSDTGTDTVSPHLEERASAVSSSEDAAPRGSK